ncbi:MAG TPA: hypothetical protein VGB46_00460 [Flavisolibacter sp.]
MAAAIMAGCNSNTGTDNTTANDGTGSVHGNATPIGTTHTKPLILDGCYEMIIRQDTAKLELTIQDTTVTGRLVYDWHEKDGNTGTIKGVLRDSLIIADYRFESEGIMSVREVVLRIHDDGLTQGFGELSDNNGKIVYADPSNLQYDTIHPFIKVPCR